MANILTIRNLTFKYNKTIIFNNFNLTIEEGKFVTIAGNNTSGKTTLIKLIAGILPSKDTINIGYSYVDSNAIHYHTKDIGVVFGSELNKFIFDDVYKELAFPLENLNIDVKDIEKRILELAHLFGISKLLDKKTNDLTNSEKQELLLILSLLHSPKLLLLDNPYSMMNKETRNRIIKALREYQKNNNLSVVLTTTNLEDSIDTDYLYIINEGNIIIEGKPLTVLKEDSILNHLGLELPFMIDLSLKLEFYELLSDIEIDMNRMVDILWK